jgi:hypothetical protein
LKRQQSELEHRRLIAVRKTARNFEWIGIGRCPAFAASTVDGAQSHSWYFGNAIFATDLFQTVIGFPSSPRTTRAMDVTASSTWHGR